LLKALNIESTSRVIVSTGRVDFFVADPTAVKQLVTTGALKVPSYVTFGQAHSLAPAGRRTPKEDGRSPMATAQAGSWSDPAQLAT
jgi:hypothetical protein